MSVMSQRSIQNICTYYIHNVYVIHTEVLANNNFSGAIVPLGYANPPTQHLIEIIKGHHFVILKLT